MKLGGNKRLKGLLNLYKVDFNPDEKYLLFSSQLLEYYRNVLYNKLAGKVAPKPPNQSKCLDMMDNIKIITRPFLEKVIVRSEEKKKKKKKKIARLQIVRLLAVQYYWLVGVHYRCIFVATRCYQTQAAHEGGGHHPLHHFLHIIICC